MPLIGTGQITITDTSDGLSILLSPFNINISTDESGNFTGSYTTTASVYLGAELQTGFTFSKSDGAGITSTIDSNTGVVTITAATQDNSYVDITATKQPTTITIRCPVVKQKQGKSSYVIDLSRDFASLQADSSGSVIDYTSANTQANVYYGTQLDTNNWNFYVSNIVGTLSYRDSDDTVDRTGIGELEGALGGSNLIPQSSFETDTNTDGKADYWDTYTAVKSVSIVTDSFHGTKAQKIVATGTVATPRLYLVQNRPQMVVGVQYTLSAYVKATAGRTIFLGYKGFTAATAGAEPDQGTSTTAVATGSYQRVVLTFTATTNNFCSPFIGLTNTPVVDSEIIIDAVQLEVAATASTYQPTGTISRTGIKGYLKVTSLTTDVGEITITATKTGEVSRTIAYSVAKIKPGAAGSNGPRGSIAAAIATTGTAWSDQAATDYYATVPSYGGPVLNDRITQYNTSASFSETRFWNGSAWLTIAQIIDGNLLVNGTVSGDKIVAGSVTADRIDSRGLSIKNSAGVVIFSAGVPLQPENAATTLRNSSININSTGEITGIGGTIARLNKNLLNSGNWSWGTTGTQPGFGENGTSTGGSNTIEFAVVPDGTVGTVWRATSGSAVTSNAEGGWNTSLFTVDHTKPYRFTVWIKRVNANTSGNYYLGVGGNSVKNLSDSTVNDNPYFVANVRTALPQGVWCLVVGYVWPSGYTSTTQTASGGTYNGQTGEKIHGSTDYKWASSAITTTQHRAYQFYTTAAGCIQEFFDPRVELIDGTEQSIAQLLATAAPSARNKITSSTVTSYLGTGAVTDSVAATNLQNNSITVSNGQLQGIGTAGVQVDNTYQTIGQNLIPHSDQTNSIRFTKGYQPNGGTVTQVAYPETNSGLVPNYVLGGTTTKNTYIYQSGRVAGNTIADGDTDGNGNYVVIDISNNDLIPVIPGQRICGSIYFQLHRCRVKVFLSFIKADGSITATNPYPMGDLVTTTPAFANTLANYTRGQVVATAPPDAAFVKLIFRKFDTFSGQDNSYVFFAAPQLEVLSSNGSASPYQPGPPVNVTSLGYTGDLDAQHNSRIEVNASGQITGIGSGNTTTIANNQINVNASGELTGTGASGVVVNNRFVETLSFTTTNTTVNGNTIKKTAGTNGLWDSQAYSKESYTLGAYVSFSPDQNNGWLMCGLNTDPATDASYTSLDYAWYPEGNGILYIYESNVYIGSFGTYAAGDILSITYDGSTVRYYQNGTLKRSIAATITNPLYFDSSFHTLNASISKVKFGPMSSNAWSQITGQPAEIYNTNISVNSSGQITGIGSGNTTTIANNQITVNTSGVINGIGTSNIQVDNSKVGGTNMLWGAQNGPHQAGPGTYGTVFALLKLGDSFNPFGLKPGEDLAVSADIWQDQTSLDAGQNATIYLFTYRSNGDWTAAASFNTLSLTPVRGSSTITLTTTAADMHGIAIGVWHQGGTVNTIGTVYADRVQVERGKVATLYAPGGEPGATSNVFAQGVLSSRPTGSDGDLFYATDNNTLYQNIGGTWVASANQTAVNASGQITGVSSGSGVTVANNQISVNSTTGNITGIGDGNGVSVANNTNTLIRNPGGGTLFNGTGAMVGSIKIRLPAKVANPSMPLFYVDIYEYVAGFACTLQLSGHNWTDGNWYEVSATIIGASNVEYPVRFGRDSDGYFSIYIGETTESWNYPQIRVRDVTIGYSAQSATLWSSDWAISFVTAHENVSRTVLDTKPGADWSKTARRPANLSNLSGTEPIQNTQITIDANGAIQGIAATSSGTTVDNSKVQVGGANLLNNSSRFSSTIGWSTTGFPGAVLTVDTAVTYAGYPTLKLFNGSLEKIGVIRLKANTEYTVSAIVKGSSALSGSDDQFLHMQCWRDENTGDLHQDVAIRYDQNITTDWKKIYRTFKTPQSAAAVYSKFYFFSIPTGYTLNIFYIKLEEGNVSTDWVATHEDTQFRLDNKLSKTSDDILSSVIDISTTTTTPVGLRVGTLAWNSTGNVTSGSGVAITPLGLIGHSGTATTFAVDSKTGNAYFQGSVDATSGNFAGSVTARTFNGDISGATGTFSGQINPASLVFAGNASTTHYNTPGTYTITAPADAPQLKITLIGGGGGGAARGGGGGGGGGRYVQTINNVVAGTQYTLTVGAGGAGGTGTSSGANGGATTISQISGATAAGGSGGQIYTTSGTGLGGAGGSGTTAGTAGSAGFYGTVTVQDDKGTSTVETATGGAGGDTVGYGTGGLAVADGQAGVGKPGSGYGGGGSSGHFPNYAGGAGAGGKAIIEFSNPNGLQLSGIRLNNIQNYAGTETIPIQTVLSGTAKAWVNFNGQGTGTSRTIRASFNVSSVTDIGVGHYTINFIDSFVDTNYVMSGSGRFDTSNVDSNTVVIGFRRNSTSIQTNNATITTVPPNSATVPFDCEVITVAFFR